MSEFLSHLQTHRNILVIDYSSLLQSVVVAVLSASLWRLLFHRRKLQGVTHLGQLRGPRSQSWLKGHLVPIFLEPPTVLRFKSGNYSQLFNLKRGWEFHRFLADECKFPLLTSWRTIKLTMIDGPTVQLKGFLGVGNGHTKFDSTVEPPFPNRENSFIRSIPKLCIIFSSRKVLSHLCIILILIVTCYCQQEGALFQPHRIEYANMFLNIQTSNTNS